MCAHCKDSECAGDGGPSFYDCPRDWEGVKCIGKLDLFETWMVKVGQGHS